jgi:hypothetical protein
LSQGELFFAGCAITFIAFELSSLDDSTRTLIKAIALEEDIIDSKIRHLSTNILELLEKTSVLGIQSHGAELGPIDLAVQEYFRNTGQVDDELDLHFVSLAMGFSAFRYDEWVNAVP